MPQLSITLFGGPSICLDGAPLAIQRNKATALLAYLATTGQAQARSALALLLWPETPNARPLLRGTLLHLRQAFGATAERWLDFGPEQLALRDEGLTVDVTEFRAGVARIRRHHHPGGVLCPACRRTAEEAVARYGGEFLAGLELDGCQEFDLWLLAQRAQLRADGVVLLAALADAHAAEHAWDAAVDCARRWLALDPLDEAAHRCLMRLYTWRERRQLALRQYDECARTLRAELDAPPEEETARLAQAIRAGAALPIPARPATAPPSRVPLRANLPAPLTALIGRDAERQAVAALLRREDVRLLTLTGPGGVGKTSLAIHVAAELAVDFADGVGFVSLAPMRDPDLIAETLARTLEVRELEQLTATAALCHALRGRHMLLLLDNFEHVLAAAHIVAELLQSCPRLKIVTTSREPLRLYGEYEVVVSPLQTPEEGKPLSVQAATTYSAVQLFAARAQAVRNAFTLDEPDVAAVVQLCRRLDGLPLAIELAAAQMRRFSAQELLARFGAAYAGNGEVAATLTILRADLRNLPDRHRSLWAAIAWSYEMLPVQEQRLFRRLAVLVGGWTVESAQAICEDGTALPVEETLWALADKHLIHHGEDGTGLQRFAMLETLREFGLEQLRATGELMQIQQRMAVHFTQMAERVSAHLTGVNAAEYHRRILVDYANIRAAWTWIEVHREVDLAVRLCAALFDFMNNNLREGEQLALATLHLAEGLPPSPKLAEVLMAAGYTSWLLGKLDAAEGYMLAALEMDEATGHQAHVGYIGVVRGMLGWRAFDRGDYATARAYFAREEELCLRFGDDWRHAMNLVNWGNLEAKLGEFEVAARMIDEALALHRRAGQPWGLVKTLADRAELHILCHEPDAAAALLDECARLLQATPMPDLEAKVALVLAMHALAQGDLPLAVRSLTRAVEGHFENGYLRGLEGDFLCVAALASEGGLPAPVLCLLGAHAARLQRLGNVDFPARPQQLDALNADARRRLDAAAADAAWQRGQAMSDDELVEYVRHEVLARLDRGEA